MRHFSSLGCHFSAVAVRGDGAGGHVDMTAGKWLAAAILALGLVPRAAGADYWRYETDSGSTAFTDDAKNIPAKYRASAVKIAEEPLATYRKLTVVQKNAAPTPKSVAAPLVAAPAPVP